MPTSLSRTIATLSIFMIVMSMGLFSPAAAADRIYVKTTDDEPIPTEPTLDEYMTTTDTDPLHSGNLDKGFGDSGIVTIPWPRADHIGPANAMLIQPDGRILVAGGGQTGLKIIRFLDDGTLDSTFGNAGIATYDPIGVGGHPAGMALRSDGKIVVAGNYNTPYGRFIARLDPDGSPDMTFGWGGYVTVGPSGTSQSLRAMALQPDGKIVVGGQWISDFYLTRYHDDGAIDVGFGATGVVTTHFPMINGAVIRSILVQADGRIIAVGMGVSEDTHTWEALLARYETDGTLDAGFGSGGTLETAVLRGARWAELQPDERIVMGGVVQDASGSDMGVTRLHSDGLLDTTFGNGGVARVDIKDESNSVEAGMFQTDGNLVIGGRAFSSSKPGQTPTTSFGLARLWPEGNIDRRFGQGGTVALALGHTTLAALAQQENGGILAAGTSIDQATQIWSYFLARFRSTNGGPGT